MLSNRTRPRLILEVLKNTKAAIDLASIMVGVLVIGVLASVIAVAVFAVIPWSQNEAAKSALNSVDEAQSVSFANAGSDGPGVYSGFSNLVANGWIEDSANADSATNFAGSCYVAVTRSDAGKFFYSTNQMPTPAEYVPGTSNTDECVGINTAGAKFMTRSWSEQTGIGVKDWTSFTASADGKVLGATAAGDFIYLSHDYGQTWAPVTSAGQRSWQGITASADGSKLAATVFGGLVHTSSDSGKTWSLKTGVGVNNWISIDSSEDGQRLVAGTRDGGTRTSADGGKTWSPMVTLSRTSVWTLAASADMRVIYSGGLTESSTTWVSTDFGITWSRANLPASRGNLLSTSRDGATAVITQGTSTMITRDYGANWTTVLRNGLGIIPRGLALSADGSKIAIATDGEIITSADFGATWTSSPIPESAGSGFPMAMSADGSRVVGGGAYGNLWTSFYGLQ
jgi:hypothetical protein